MAQYLLIVSALLMRLSLAVQDRIELVLGMPTVLCDVYAVFYCVNLLIKGRSLSEVIHTDELWDISS